MAPGVLVPAVSSSWYSTIISQDQTVLPRAPTRSPAAGRGRGCPALQGDPAAVPATAGKLGTPRLWNKTNKPWSLVFMEGKKIKIKIKGIQAMPKQYGWDSEKLFCRAWTLGREPLESAEFQPIRECFAVGEIQPMPKSFPESGLWIYIFFLNTNNSVELTRNQNRASVRVIVASVLILFSSWYPLLLSMEIWFSLCLHWSFYWLNTQPQQQENQALHIYSLPLNTSRIPFGLSSAVSRGALNANGITVIT